MTYIKLYTTAELAERCGYHPDTLRKLFAAGKIAAVKDGGKWFSTIEAVEKYCWRW